jgi:replicative DNA helicase
MAAARPVPPPALRNDDAERAVLGRVLIDPASFGDMAARLNPESFADVRNRHIWRGIVALMQTYGTVSRPTLMSQIGDDEDSGDTVSLATYLAGLTALAAQPEQLAVQAAQLADAVAHPAARRDLVAAADQIRDMAMVAALDLPIDELRARADRLIAANDNRAVSESRPIGTAVSDVIRAAHEAAKTGTRPGIRTGFKAFDSLVGAMLPGQLIVIGGETSSGKTALAMGLAYRVAVQKIPVGVTSLEMSETELVMRYLAQFSGVAVEDIVDAKLKSEDFDRLMQAGERLYDLPITIDDQPRQNVGMLHARANQDIARFGCKLRVIDHLQYVRTDMSRGQEHEQIRQVVDDIKAMAKRLAIPVILISHIARAATETMRVSQASDIRLPTLNVLYGSSAIEKAADAVLFTHRPVYFLERSTPLPKYEHEHARDMQRWRDRAQLVLPKRRMGKGHGIRECGFDEARTWFSDLPEPGDLAF